MQLQIRLWFTNYFHTYILNNFCSKAVKQALCPLLQKKTLFQKVQEEVRLLFKIP